MASPTALRAVAPLLVATAPLLAAHGLVNAVVALRGSHEGFAPWLIGLATTAYFCGYLAGAWWVPRLVGRIGPIRTFASCAALATIAVLLLPLWTRPEGWLLLRAAMGVALVGLSTVIEGWLAGQAAPEQRSRVLAAYMAINLVALASGPLLLGVAEPGSPLLFSVAAILLAAAALPVTLVPRDPPPPAPVQQVDVLALARRAPTAVGGVALIGLALGAFWGLAPVHAEGQGLDRGEIGLLIAATVLGGAALQWPVGRWSDGGDRRTVLAWLSLAGAAALGATAVLDHPAALFAGFTLAGGALFAVYPLCMAHLFDRIPPDRAVAACGGLLIANGAGAAVGPLLAGLAMSIHPEALPWTLAAALGMIAVLATLRRATTGFIGVHARRALPMIRTSPAVLRLLVGTRR